MNSLDGAILDGDVYAAYMVTICEVQSQWIFASRGTFAKESEISATMLGLLGEAWAAVKRDGIKTDGQNVAIYRGSMIEAGPRVLEKREGCVATPAGRAAMVVHMGPYERLGTVHGEIRNWCSENGHVIEGTNWEIYGHHEEDASRRRTDVFYLLRS